MWSLWTTEVSLRDRDIHLFKLKQIWATVGLPSWGKNPSPRFHVPDFSLLNVKLNDGLLTFGGF